MAPSNKVLRTPLRIALVALLTGFIMRVLELPYTDGIIFTAFLAIAILYGIRFLKKDPKRPVAIIKMILVLFWTTNGLLKILDFPYTLIFQIGTAITFVIWFAMEGTAYFMDDDRRAKNTLLEVAWNFAMVLGVLISIGGGLMHLFGWENAIPVITLGLTVVTAYILKDIFTPQKSPDKRNHDEMVSPE
ncbi:hypothetical protein [Maribacter sp. 2307ULW6-5]|uniref:hypothetical protein n=1 Tax=Maribacter sp. 2307ULW6-5 TaxID=3386275 RepID=UPI0039BC98DA